MNFTLDNMLKCEWRGEKISPLMAKILYVLHFRKGDVVPADDLIDFIYPNPDEQPLSALLSIRTSISWLRKVFNITIQSIYGRGYRV